MTKGDVAERARRQILPAGLWFCLAGVLYVVVIFVGLFGAMYLGRGVAELVGALVDRGPSMYQKRSVWGFFGLGLGVVAFSWGAVSAAKKDLLPKAVFRWGPETGAVVLVVVAGVLAVVGGWVGWWMGGGVASDAVSHMVGRPVASGRGLYFPGQIAGFIVAGAGMGLAAILANLAAKRVAARGVARWRGNPVRAAELRRPAREGAAMMPKNPAAGSALSNWLTMQASEIARFKRTAQARGSRGVYRLIAGEITRFKCAVQARASRGAYRLPIGGRTVSGNGDGHGAGGDVEVQLGALRTAVSTDVQEAVDRYVGRAVESGVEPDVALDAACGAVVGACVEKLATAREAGGGSDATAGAIGEAEGIAGAAVRAKGRDLMRKLVD